MTWIQEREVPGIKSSDHTPERHHYCVTRKINKYYPKIWTGKTESMKMKFNYMKSHLHSKYSLNTCQEEPRWKKMKRQKTLHILGSQSSHRTRSEQRKLYTVHRGQTWGSGVHTSAVGSYQETVRQSACFKKESEAKRGTWSLSSNILKAQQERAFEGLDSGMNSQNRNKLKL